MGCCFSFGDKPSASFPPPLRVLSLDGLLREYPDSVTVSQVLGTYQQSCFLCDGSSIFPDSTIPAMHPEDLLEPGHVYFVLPVDRLRHPLSGSEVVALAVRTIQEVDGC